MSSAAASKPCDMFSDSAAVKALLSQHVVLPFRIPCLKKYPMRISWQCLAKAIGLAVTFNVVTEGRYSYNCAPAHCPFKCRYNYI